MIDIAKWIGIILINIKRCVIVALMAISIPFVLWNSVIGVASIVYGNIFCLIYPLQLALML